MQTRIFIIVVLMASLTILNSCNRPECENTNEVFENYLPTNKEYKDELVTQLEKSDESTLRYWVKEYAVRGNEDFIYFDIQGDGICAVIEINMTVEKHNHLTESLHNGVESKHREIGATRTSIEFFDLEYDIIQDSLHTEFIFRDFGKHGFD